MVSRTVIPVTAMVESIVGCKWSMRLLDLCAEGCTRPSAVLRACPGLSAKVMNERWRKMLRYGIVRRVVSGDKPPVEVDYLLTPFGHRFIGIIEEVRKLQAAMDAGEVSEDGEGRVTMRGAAMARENAGAAGAFGTTGGPRPCDPAMPAACPAPRRARPAPSADPARPGRG